MENLRLLHESADSIQNVRNLAFQVKELQVRHPDALSSVHALLWLACSVYCDVLQTSNYI